MICGRLRNIVLSVSAASCAICALLLLIPGDSTYNWVSVGFTCIAWILISTLIVLLVIERRQYGHFQSSTRNNASAPPSQMVVLRERSHIHSILEGSQSNPLRQGTRKGVDASSNTSSINPATWNERPTNIAVACEAV